MIENGNYILLRMLTGVATVTHKYFKQQAYFFSTGDVYASNLFTGQLQDVQLKREGWKAGYMHSYVTLKCTAAISMAPDGNG